MSDIENKGRLVIAWVDSASAEAYAKLLERHPDTKPEQLLSEAIRLRQLADAAYLTGAGLFLRPDQAMPLNEVLDLLGFDKPTP